MTNKEKFIKMCHSIYDNIHGEDKIKTIFYPISEEELNNIIKIYTTHFYTRMYLIKKYLNTLPKIKNKITLTNGRKLDTSSFYINALQHYTINRLLI